MERQGTLPDAGADSYLLSDFQGMADYQYEAGFTGPKGRGNLQDLSILT